MPSDLDDLSWLLCLFLECVRERCSILSNAAKESVCGRFSVFDWWGPDLHFAASYLTKVTDTKRSNSAASCISVVGGRERAKSRKLTSQTCEPENFLHRQSKRVSRYNRSRSRLTWYFSILISPSFSPFLKTILPAHSTSWTLSPFFNP